jgi:hypothetical protein
MCARGTSAHPRRRRLTLETLESRRLLTGPHDWRPAGDGDGEPPPAQVAFRLAVTDLAGVPVAQTLPGTELCLEVYVQDVRPGAMDAGVFAAYLDVDYAAELLAVVASDTNPLGFEIEFGASYQNGRWARADVAGLIDEAGAFQFGSNPLGPDEFLLFRTRLVAGSMTLQDDAFAGIAEDSTDVVLDVLANDLFVTGTARLAASPADITPAHDVITFSPPQVVPASEIDYGQTVVEVTTVGGQPITAVTQPSTGGTVRIAPGGEHLLYTPPPEFAGSEVFSYTVAGRQSALVVVDVEPVNDPPQAADHIYRLGRNEPLLVDAVRGLLRGATDPEGDPLEAVLVDAPLHGDLVLRADGSFDYMPTADFVGTDRFTYAVEDPWQASQPAEVLLEVGGPRVSLRLEVTDADGELLEPVVAGETAFVRVWVRDLRDDFYPDRGVFAAYLDVLFDPAVLQPLLDDQLPLGFAVEFGPAFIGNGSGDAALAGVVNEVGAWSSLDGPSGPEEQVLLTLPLLAVNPRGADDRYAVSYQSTLNLLDVLTNDRALVWTTTVGSEAADDLPAHDVLLWTPRSAVPPAEVLYGEASVALANAPGLKILEAGPASHGGTVTIGSDGEHIAYSPAAGFAGIETFTYVLVDPRGRTAAAEVAVEVVPSWQNVRRPLDVNSDTFVSAIDALLIINYLNAGHPSRPEGTPGGPPFWDVTGDGYIAPLDALLVINYLNRLARGEGEAAPAMVAVGARAAGPAVDAAAAGEAVAEGWLVAAAAVDRRRAVPADALAAPRRADAAPAWPAPPHSEAGLRDPLPAAGRLTRRGLDELAPRHDPLTLEELCALLAAARHGEPGGG